MKKGCLWTMLIMIVLTMFCTVPYKKYEGYLFTDIRERGTFELDATYNDSGTLTAVSGNPYTLKLLFWVVGGTFLDGKVLIKQLELSTLSTGEVVYFIDENVEFELSGGSSESASSPNAVYKIPGLKLKYEHYKLIVKYQFIDGDEHSDVRTIEGIFHTEYHERWFNPIWSTWMSV